jgi:hypothetical protein
VLAADLTVGVEYQMPLSVNLLKCVAPAYGAGGLSEGPGPLARSGFPGPPISPTRDQHRRSCAL